MVGWAEMRARRSCVLRPSAVGTDRGGFDGFAEAACRSYYAARLGAPSVPPGRYFRMHLVLLRGASTLSAGWMALLGFPVATGVSTAGKIGAGPFMAVTDPRMPHEVHTAIFDWVLALIAEAGLVKGERIGVDASTIFQRGAAQHRAEGHGRGLPGDAGARPRTSGIETPTAEDLARLDRQAQGQEAARTSDWVSKSDLCAPR